MIRKRVVITGMGWVTPLGRGIDAVWQRLLAADSGIASTTIFDARTFPTSFAAEVKELPTDGAEAGIDGYLGRNSLFALAAARDAWQSARLPAPENLDALDHHEVGVYLGSGEGSLDFENFTHAALAGWNDQAGKVDTAVWAKEAMEHFSAARELEQEPSMPLSHISSYFKAYGPALNCLTACAASTQAIGEATEIIRAGQAQIMISGGAHSMIHPFGVTGFNRLTALSTLNENPRAACRPFDATRGGFVIGEGSGIVILESLEHARQRGAPIFAEVAGYGSSADAYRVTDQHPQGRGAIAAIREALADANLSIDAIDYINAHGTGTKENDSTETLAIKGVFGERAKRVPISSIKSMMGHLIAAAGAVEAIACALTIRDGVIPPTANYSHPDPECDLDYVPNKARKATVNVAMSNSFGFGGQNDTIILKRI